MQSLTSLKYVDASPVTLLPRRVLGLIGKPWFSGRAIVPPAISGLLNGDNLRAWAEVGLDVCVGDSTIPNFVNDTNPFSPWYTSE